jgi:thiamine-phosphate diphosphorylase
LQLREKDASTGGFYGIACRVQEAARAAGIPLIVNDRLDIALAVGAEGLHIGQSDLPVAAARRICDEYTGATKKKRLWIGVSAGTVEEARSAERDGADYIGAGPIFPTGSKADAGDAIGLEGLKAITRSVHIPVVGIGGINADNTPQVMAAGSVGVAVISAILSAPDIRQAAAAIRAAVSKAVPKNAWRDALGGRGMIQ